MARINHRSLILLLAALITGAGCTRTFPTEVTDRVDKNITFSDVVRDPQTYKGKTLMLAGTIVNAKVEKDGSYLEILQVPADRNGKPLRTDESAGRFIAVSKEFFDPSIYRPGRPITVVGEVIGDSVKPLEGIAYRYPLLRVDAVHLWETAYGPRVSFGVGVGVFHRF